MFCRAENCRRPLLALFISIGLHGLLLIPPRPERWALMSGVNGPTLRARLASTLASRTSAPETIATTLHTPAPSARNNARTGASSSTPRIAPSPTRPDRETISDAPLAPPGSTTASLSTADLAEYRLALAGTARSLQRQEALRGGPEGRITLRLHMARGVLLALETVSGSGDEARDQAVFRLLREAILHTRLPGQLPDKQFSIDLTLAFDTD